MRLKGNSFPIQLTWITITLIDVKKLFFSTLNPTLTHHHSHQWAFKFGQLIPHSGGRCPCRSYPCLVVATAAVLARERVQSRYRKNLIELKLLHDSISVGHCGKRNFCGYLTHYVILEHSAVSGSFGVPCERPPISSFPFASALESGCGLCWNRKLRSWAVECPNTRTRRRGSNSVIHYELAKSGIQRWTWQNAKKGWRNVVELIFLFNFFFSCLQPPSLAVSRIPFQLQARRDDVPKSTQKRDKGELLGSWFRFNVWLWLVY